ncbi:hypothetical protein ACT29H_09365 [Thermophagus sp. OGC60D27]|uniref:hypothetical protein n=1 Tax=Thermophagus sp. OGC60D27 TaxID=3458415 RepID=UPI004038482E
MAEKFKAKIEELLKSESFDVNKAVDLYLKYGRNKNLARNFARNPKRYSRKIKWELSKMIGISLVEFHGCQTGKDKKILPPIIIKIKGDLSELYKQQAELQKKLVDLGDSNSEESKLKAIEIGKEIDAVAFRYDELAKAKEEFFKKGIIPDEKKLYPSSKSDDPFGLQSMSAADIMRRRGNLVSSITKDQNKLKYQSDTKLEKENPMPEGEKRRKIEERLKKKNEELKAIDDFLNNK